MTNEEKIIDNLVKQIICDLGDPIENVVLAYLSKFEGDKTKLRIMIYHHLAYTALCMATDISLRNGIEYQEIFNKIFNLSFNAFNRAKDTVEAMKSKEGADVN